MKHRSIGLALVMALLLNLASCTPPQADCQGTENAVVITEQATVAGEKATVTETDKETEKASEALSKAETEIQTEKNEEETLMKEARNVGNRYFIYRIWNFTPMTQKEFESIVDSAAETGFNAIKVHIPWSRVETSEAGKYDFSPFDPMVEYVVKAKGLKIAISLDLTRRADDKIIPLDQMQYDQGGNLCQGGSGDGMRTMISFCSESAVNSAVAFYTAAVKHYEEKYSEDVLFYLPAFSQYAESEYWCAGEYDYSSLAKQQFRAFLQQKYSDINELNRVLGTNYSSFDKIEPPATTASDNLGQLWYQFRHQKLKAIIDALAMSQKKIAPNSKYALQFGSIYDAASPLRCTLGAGDLAEYADVVWIDDGPNTEHEFSMDYSNATFPAHIQLAQEIDGPIQVGATPEKYLDQGMDSFSRGCTYLSIANWHINQTYRDYEWVWKQLIDTWFGDDVPEVVDTTATEPAMEISLTDLLRRRNPSVFINRYYAMAKNGEFVSITLKDDLSAKAITEPSTSYAFPNSFSNEQGKGGWYYTSYQQKRGKFIDMTYDAENARWQGKAPYTLISAGSMHPDEYDSALVFEAPKNGLLRYSVTLAIVSDQGDGITYAILKNNTPLLDGENGYVYLSPDAVFDGTLEIKVEEGDRIALVIGKHVTNTFDATSVAVMIEYLE